MDFFSLTRRWFLILREKPLDDHGSHLCPFKALDQRISKTIQNIIGCPWKKSLIFKILYHSNTFLLCFCYFLFQYHSPIFFMISTYIEYHSNTYIIMIFCWMNLQHHRLQVVWCMSGSTTKTWTDGGEGSEKGTKGGGSVRSAGCFYALLLCWKLNIN